MIWRNSVAQPLFQPQDAGAKTAFEIANRVLDGPVRLGVIAGRVLLPSLLQAFHA